MLHLVHRSKGRCSCRKSLLKLIKRIQQTTLKNIRKPIRPNCSSLYATARLEPLRTISRCAQRRTRLGHLRFVRMRARSMSLRSVRMGACARCMRTVYICLLTIVFRARARQARLVFRYTPCERARYIELLFHFPTRTVRNTNSWLNFRACARNVSPCCVKCGLADLRTGERVN